jgi:hypothetical protein
MKKPLLVVMGILTTWLVCSCKSTGTTSAPKAGPSSDSDPSPNLSPGPGLSPQEEQSLEFIYERHDDAIILTGAKEYTVIKGDTLSKIARENYGAGGNAYYFPLIIAASKDSADIVDPDSIEVGMKLVIPSLQENLNNPAARNNLKSLIKEIADFYSRKSGGQSAGLYDGLIRLHEAL